MKKFLTISMMALAMAFVSSCNKDGNGTGEEAGEATLVKTWVTDEIPASLVTDIVLDRILPSDIPEEVLADLAALAANAKIRLAVDFKEDKTGGVGVILDKDAVNVLITGIKMSFAEHEKDYPGLEEMYGGILDKVAEKINDYNDGDYIGASYTYVATPADAASGEISLVFKVDDREDGDAEGACKYSGLTASKVILSEVIEFDDVVVPDDEPVVEPGDDEPVMPGEDEPDEPVVLELTSASSANVKVGELHSLMDVYKELFIPDPDEGEEGKE